MRDALTVLAIAVCVILGAALAIPYLVDWSSLRGPIEARLTQALGRETRIGGKIDLRLLPAPYALVEDISLADAPGGAGEATWRASAARMRLEIGLMPLLRGEFDFTQARVERPRVEIRLGRDRMAGAPSGLPFTARFSGLTASDGEIVIFDAQGARRFAASQVELQADAASLLGPFKARGALTTLGERITFRLGGGAFEAGALPLKLSAQGAGGTLTFDGVASFAPQAKLGGALRVERGAARADASLEMTAERADFSGLAIALGDGPGALSATGEAHVDLAVVPAAASASLTAERLDLDGFRAASPQAWPGLAAPSFPLTLSCRAKSVTLGRAAFSDVAAELVAPGAGAEKGWLRFSTHGPLGSRLSFDGATRWGEAPGFDGALRAEGRAVGWLDDWLRRFLPDLRAPKFPFSDVEIAAQARWAPGALALRDLVATLDGTRLAGDLELATPATGAPRLDADLTTPRLDLSGAFFSTLRGEAARPLSEADGTLRFKADEIAVLGSDALGALSLVAERSGGRVALRELSYVGPDGAVAQANGLLSDAGADLKMNAKIARGGALAQALAPLAQTQAQRRALGRLAALTPIDLSASLGAERRGESLALSALTAQGTMAGVSLSASARPDGEALAVTASAESRASLPLLRLAGLSPVAAPDPGPARLDATARFDARAPTHRASLNATLGQAKLGFSGEIGADLAVPSARGALSFSASDATPLLRSAGLAPPDAKDRFSASFKADISLDAGGALLGALKGEAGGVGFSGELSYAEGRPWTGALAVDRLAASSLLALVLGPAEPVKSGASWSSLAFAPPGFEPPRADVALRARQFVLGPPLTPARRIASDAKLDLSLAPGRLAVDDLSLRLAGGEARGAFTLARAGREASLSAKIEISGAAIDLPGARGRLDAAFDVSGTGASAEALAGGLAGAGSARIADLTLPRADPGALGRVIARFDREGQDVSARAISAALTAEVKRAELKAGERRFDLAVKAGFVNLVSAPPSPSAPALSAALDLRRSQLAQRVVLTDPQPPKGWSGEPAQVALLAKGPPTAPSFEIDAAALSNALAMRALERESARIEAFEYDFRERAFFRRRLAFDRRLEAERDRAAQEKAEREKAEREKEAQEKAAHEKAARAKDEAAAPAPP